MAIIKCKMCGGDLNVAGDSQIAVCEYCGTQQTVPKQDNEKKLTLFARANRLRFSCEFDKAAGVYESIVAEFPEEPEAYWGLVLCKYGIEYVDDPATGKKVPTCHRSSFDSVLVEQLRYVCVHWVPPSALFSSCSLQSGQIYRILRSYERISRPSACSIRLCISGRWISSIFPHRLQIK